MDVEDRVEPIADDEEVYRRIPCSQNWYDPTTGSLSPLAFDPHKKRDTTGISVYRARFKSIEDAAVGRPDKSYFVAVLRVGDLRQHGIRIVPRPQVEGGFDPAHAELPDLNAVNRKTTEAINHQQLLAKKLCLRVEGPFHPGASQVGPDAPASG